MKGSSTALWPAEPWVNQGGAYAHDAVQRSVLFWDIIRKRGNQYLDHLSSGQPPVLAFEYDIVSDGRQLETPVNYQLVKIRDRRQEETEKIPRERRFQNGESDQVDKRPIVVIDPRAGHGPGIGGSKMDSQIGVALDAGHPVYFIMFLVRPVPGQTIAQVQECQVGFLEIVAARHPDVPKPAVIGNCQAGWAAALIAADKPDLTGPLVLNGSPLSYWGGVKGANPMRYRGGLFGGSWLAALSSDLGNGIFDGAHLVAGFNELNPANSLWTKMYHLYSNVDTEERRFLDFEKWWGGFFFLDRNEINFIANNLFISDELEQGFLTLHEGGYIDLKNFKAPILVFASRGDNITPPQQALNWISKLYGSVDEIKENRQTIIYLLHDTIGHLGIFVSSKVTLREHKSILSCVNAIEFLAPGLYEMVIEEEPSRPGLSDYKVRFMERSIQDILALDDGLEDEEAFPPVAAVSRFNDKLYRDHLSPWVKAFSTEDTAELIRQLHPLRVQRYGFSDQNPLMRPLESMAASVREHRQPVADGNIFSAAEALASDLMVNTLELYRKTRDDIYETMFYTLYGNLWIKTLLFSGEGKRVRTKDREPEKSEMFKTLEHELWLSAMREGGFEAAVIRIILAVISADQVFDMAEYDEAKSIMKEDQRLKDIEPEQLKIMIRDQAAILEKDRDQAIKTLPDLIPDQKDRVEAIKIAKKLADIKTIKKFKKAPVFSRIGDVLLSG